MDYRSLTLLMLRLTGVVVMVQAIIATPKTLAILFMKPAEASPDISAWLLTIASGFPILVGLFLIYFPGTIANRIMSPGEQSVDTPEPAAARVFGPWSRSPYSTQSTGSPSCGSTSSSSTS